MLKKNFILIIIYDRNGKVKSNKKNMDIIKKRLKKYVLRLITFHIFSPLFFF